MNASKQACNGFRIRQRGQGMTEYIIITALIAIAAIGAVTYFGQTAREQVAGMAKELSGKSGRANMNAAGNAANKASMEGNENKSLSNYHSDVNN